MPVKWIPEMDQLLLLKILETCDVNADAKKISAAWPTDCPNGLPTPRAITERLVRIRDSAKKTGAAHSNTSSAQSKGKRAGGTPRKSRAGNGSGGKRKRGDGAGNAAEDDEEEERVGVKVLKEEEGGRVWGEGAFAMGDADGEDVEEGCVEWKRVNREGTGKVNGYADDGEVGGENGFGELVEVDRDGYPA
ncbi:hypothetical protein LPUS_10246 [Lasallia pustulata]|uniref:Uncharacterized protein n=1 Tax=Lasallia pustulata TaxID=136370 RepID=A0A1W5D948_9LECA|nr:hypothetical protein LPUS_10246 [Lasallia pustulata]